MIHFTAIIEDSVIVATDRQGGDDLMDVTVTDSHFGKQKRVVWTFKQFSAVLALAMGMGEDGTLDTATTERLYVIARPLCTGEDWKGVCPIP